MLDFAPAAQGGPGGVASTMRVRNVRRWVAGAAALSTSVLGIVALGGQGAGASPTPYKVGVVTEETGLYSYYIAEWLQGMHIGLQYATNGTDEVNGHPISLTIDDDADNPTTAATDFKSFVGSGYDVIGGTGDSAIADELGPLAEQNKVLYISGAAADDEITGMNRYTFRSGRQAYQDVTAAEGYIKKLGKGKKVVVLAQDYAFGLSYISDATHAFQKEGDKVTSIAVPLTTTDFTPVALQVAQDKPQVVFLAWAGTTGAALAQALQQQNLFKTAKVITGLGPIVTYGFYGAAGLDFDYISLYNYASPHNSVNTYLINKMKSEYAGVPDLFTADGFVWSEMVVHALAAGDGTNVNKMISALQGWTFKAPKGTQQVRADDHAMLQPMFDVTLTEPTPGNYKVVTTATLSAKQTAPPVTAHF